MYIFTRIDNDLLNTTYSEIDLANYNLHVSGIYMYISGNRSSLQLYISSFVIFFIYFARAGILHESRAKARVGKTFNFKTSFQKLIKKSIIFVRVFYFIIASDNKKESIDAT